MPGSTTTDPVPRSLPRRAVHSPVPTRGALAQILVLCALPVGSAQLSAQEGYTVEGNQIRVQTREHWQAWDVAVGAAVIAPDGTIAPRYLRRRVNAALDAPEHGGDEPGRIEAGTNGQDAPFLIDGDPNTSWGPDLDAPRSRWWAQLRLGRVVVVDSVVVRFAREVQGEPFLQFEVLGWRRPPPLTPSGGFIVGTSVAQLWSLFRTDRPNRDQRHFSIVPRTTERASSGFVGDPLEVIRVELVDSELDRLAEVTAAAYQALPQDARGAVAAWQRESRC